MDKRQMDNRGFSIVELLVALAIGAILVAGIGSIMIVTSKSFSSTSGEAGMQSSAQIVMDHIQDVVIDANQKIEYSYTTSDTPTAADWTETIKDSDIAASYDDITYKRLAVYNFDMNDVDRRRLYEIKWKHNKSDDEKSEIYYCEYYLDENLNPGAAVSTEEKLADNVIVFSCDLTDIPKKRILFAELKFKKGTKEYEAHNNFSLRNKVALSVNTVSMDASVSVNTIDLNAEPGVDLPLAVKNVKTTGNASNQLIYELKDDSGKTADDTAIVGKKTLHVSPAEQADKIKVWATSTDTGESFDFYVYVNRVLWTSDIPKGKGHDTVEGIVVAGSDEVNPNSSNVYSVTLNSNPGASIDRTIPPRVKAEIVKVEPVTYLNSVSLNESGSTAWELVVQPLVKENTTITMKFTALHSYADSSIGGGMSIRNTAYPDDQHIFKLKTVTVKGGGAGSGNGFFRGMIGNVPFKDLITDPNAGGFFDGEGQRYLLWRPYRERAAVDGRGHNVDDAGWSAPFYTDEVEKKTRVDDYTGWHKISGGYNANFHGEEFNCLSPNYDTEIQYFVVKVGNGGVIDAITGVATDILYGFRANISKNDGTHKGKCIYLGTYYTLDNVAPKWFDEPFMKVWQLEPCFSNLAYVQNAQFDMKMMLSRELGANGTQVGGNIASNETDGGDGKGFGGFDIKMSRRIHFGGGTWGNGDGVKNKLTVGDDAYYIWPQFNYKEANHGYGDSGEILPLTRADAAMKFYAKTGNITINNTEAFVPWPKHIKDDFEIASHDNFYGKLLQAWSESYQSVGLQKIKDANGQEKSYYCSMRFKDETYWLKLVGVANYKYNATTERWERVGADNFKANLKSGLNQDKKDVYLPGTNDDEFYTGFKNIQHKTDTDPALATGMTLYSTLNGPSLIDRHKISYYRSGGQNYVNIYWLEHEDRLVYKRYRYNETAEEWVEEGEMFVPNLISGLNGKNTKDVCLPGPGELEFFAGFKNNNTTPALASGMELYFRTNGFKQITNYKISYYKESGRYCVNIYWLEKDDPLVFTKYYYDETAKEWKNDGDIYGANTAFAASFWGGPDVSYSFYVPSYHDGIDYYQKFATADAEWRAADGMTVYVYDSSNKDHPWSLYKNAAYANPRFEYASKGTNRQNIRITYYKDFWTSQSSQYTYSSGAWR